MTDITRCDGASMMIDLWVLSAMADNGSFPATVLY
jgi:hypothetical protein